MSEMPDEQLPLAVPTTWNPTGDVRVDSAVELLSDIRDLPLHEQHAVY